MNDKSAPTGNPKSNATADSALVSLYAATQSSHAEQPAEELDAKILEMAANPANLEAKLTKSGTTSSKRWFIPQSLVATLALAVGVGVIFHQEREEILSPEPRALSLPAPKTMLQKPKPAADSTVSEVSGDVEEAIAEAEAVLSAEGSDSMQPELQESSSWNKMGAEKEAQQRSARASEASQPTVSTQSSMSKQPSSSPPAESAPVLETLDQLSDKLVVEPKYEASQIQPKKKADFARDGFRYIEQDSAGRREGTLKDSTKGEKQKASNTLGSSLDTVDELDPESWLDDIYSLYEGGELGEARIELMEFQDRYPEYELPTELQYLLQR